MFLHLIFVLIIFTDTVRYNGGACKRISLSIDFIEVENADKGSILCEKMIISKISRIEGRSENIEDREVVRSKGVNKKIFRVLRAGIRLTVHRSLQLKMRTKVLYFAEKIDNFEISRIEGRSENFA